jgi:Na+-driven multidrug efflux pump
LCANPSICFVVVAAWAVTGVVWDFCLAATEGLGEAASVRVSFHLAEGYPADAKSLASKIAVIAFIEGLVITSILLVAGPNIATLLAKRDYNLENMINNLIGLTALANISMAFAQVYWSLAGAQGSFGIASATILLSRWLVTIPIACTCIFAYKYDLDALAGAVAVGYATAAFVLSVRVFSSNWMSLSLAAQEELLPLDGEGDLSSDSSVGF